MSASEARGRTAGLSRTVLGLALTPGVVAVAAHFAPELRVGPRAADSIAFTGATLVPILALAIAASVRATRGLVIAVAVPACAVLLGLSLLHFSPIAAMLLVDTALVAIAWSVGASLGWRVQHPAHLLPACAVAASADIASLL